MLVVTARRSRLSMTRVIAGARVPQACQQSQPFFNQQRQPL